MVELKKISLKPVSRDDVTRIKKWLRIDEVMDHWFGRYSYGDPAHLGYHPEKIQQVSEADWEKTFNNPEHRIMSIYSSTEDHIGEVHFAIEASLGDCQFSVLIGDPHNWHHGYGEAATKRSLEIAFGEYAMYRVWVDIPEFNTAAVTLFQKLGFVHEGTLRKSRPHHGARFDSVIMGILSSEYVAR